MTKMNKIHIQLAAAENTITKVINHHGKKKTYHNGGFRVGLVIDGNPYAAINKQATYPGMAESWGVLRAVEWAIAQGCSALRVETVSHCASAKRKSRFFLDLAAAKAEVANMRLEITAIGKDGNQACNVARSSSSPFLPRVAEESPEFKRGVAIALKAIQTSDGAYNPAEEETLPPPDLGDPSPVAVAADLMDD